MGLATRFISNIIFDHFGDCQGLISQMRGIFTTHNHRPKILRQSYFRHVCQLWFGKKGKLGRHRYSTMGRQRQTHWITMALPLDIRHVTRDIFNAEVGWEKKMSRRVRARARQGNHELHLVNCVCAAEQLLDPGASYMLPPPQVASTKWGAQFTKYLSEKSN